MVSNGFVQSDRTVGVVPVANTVVGPAVVSDGVVQNPVLISNDGVVGDGTVVVTPVGNNRFVQRPMVTNGFVGGGPVMVGPGINRVGGVMMG